MKIFVIAFLSALVAVLATLALAGYIFFRITKRYFDNQQKMQMLQMRAHSAGEPSAALLPAGHGH